MLLSAKACKPGARCPAASLKEALHCSLHHDDKGRSIAFFAEQAGIRAQTLNDQINPDQEQDNVPLRRLPSLVSNLSNFAALDYLESLAGRVAFELPKGNAFEERAQAKAVREFAQYLEQASVAGEDGEYTDEEVAIVEKEARDAVAAIMAHMEAMKSRVRSRALTAVK